MYDTAPWIFLSIPMVKYLNNRWRKEGEELDGITSWV